MSIESFKSNCNFYDAINFRHGFGRSGVFTRREAEILSLCGYVIRQLEQGSLLPGNKDHKNMLLVIEGKIEPRYEIEKVWVKYTATIHSKTKKFNGLSSELNGVDYSDIEGDGDW